MLAYATHRAQNGLIDADLGSSLLKQRIVRRGGGNAGGYRSILNFRSGARTVFVVASARSDKANLNGVKLNAYHNAAGIMLELSDPNDEMVLEAAVNGRANALVTHNVRDFVKGAERFGLRVLRPGDLLKELRS